MMRFAMIAVLLSAVAVAASPGWTAQRSGVSDRLRGVSAPSNSVAWASGDKGTVLRTVDGGATWTRIAVPGAETLDFRDIEAFDESTAHVLSIGPGAASRIYRTLDGGKTWTLSFQNADPRAFYDAIAFWDPKTGLAFGDPVDGRFTVIRTTDAGATWTPIPASGMPPALEGEGAFAASGTCLVVQGIRNAWFGTGGAARARVFRSTDRGMTWTVADTPVAAGAPSAGIFSLSFAAARIGVAVGGDYKRERDTGDNLAFTEDGGATWTLSPSIRLRSFRSAVAFVPRSRGRRLIAAGPAGADTSADGGITWVPVSDEGFHALAIAPSGGAAWAVGERGKIGHRAP